MRIELLAGENDPVYYRFHKSQLIIGSDLSADIPIRLEEISRKHLIVGQDQDQFYVIDQGSTNGSYINEERLIPGRKVEFTSYFPVRLGTSVLLSLVGDEEKEDKIEIPFPVESSAPKSDPRKASSSDKTMMISLKDLQKSSTESLVKRRQEVEKKKVKGSGKTKKKKKGFKLEAWHLLIFLILVGALYKTYLQETKVEAPPVLSEHVSPAKSDAKQKALNSVIAKALAPAPMEIIRLREESSRCEGEVLKKVCAMIKGSEAPWGSVFFGEQIIVLLDGSPYFREAEKLLTPPQIQQQEAESPLTEDKVIDLPLEGQAPAVEVPKAEPSIPLPPELQHQYEKELWTIAVAIFIRDGFNNDDYVHLTQDLIFSFFQLRGDQPILKVTVAIRPEGLRELRRTLIGKNFSLIAKERADFLKFADQYIELTLLD